MKEQTLYYNGEILAECDGESMPIRRHLTGLGLSRAEDISTNTGYTYHQDEQGSTAYVTGTTGETENLYSYDGFGNLLEKKEDIANRILYTGQQYDQEAGQYYLRARYYNPVIGRFTQEDTYRGDGLNLYAYCGNNPVMYYDPSGHGMLDSIGAALGGCPVQTNASQKNTQAEKVNSESGSETKGFNPPDIYKNEDGVLTNGVYTIDPKAMNKHRLNSLNDGKSQFLSDIDSDKAVLDAAAYADEYNLWGGSDHGNKAKVPVANGPVGVVYDTGELTDYINVYRTADGKVHGSPGNPPT